MAQDRNQKRSHTGRNVGAAAVLVALLLGGRYGLGIGRGSGGEGFLPESGNSTQSETVETAQTAEPREAESTAEPGDDGVLSIVVREDKLYYEDEEISLSALEQALLRDYVKDSSTVTLTDDHAIKSAYDAVTALLDRLGIPTG